MQSCILDLNGSRSLKCITREIRKQKTTLPVLQKLKQFEKLSRSRNFGAASVSLVKHGNVASDELKSVKFPP